MTATAAGPLRWLRPDTGRPVVLACPQAGSGARSFESLQLALGDTASVLSLQGPGREDRWAEPAASSVGQIVAEVRDALTPVLAGGQSLVLLGCSFGGLLAYEVARRLPASAAPRAMVIASCRAPRWWADGVIDEAETELMLATLRQRMAELDLDEESRRILQQPMTSDIELSRRHRLSTGGEPLRVPVMTLRGQRDPLVSADQIREWAATTTAGSQHRELDAGHDLAAEAPADLAEALRTWLVPA